MEKNIFFKELSFARENSKDLSEPKIALFTDMYNNSAIVKTTWNGVVPNIRYDCKLIFSRKVDDLFEYQLLSFSIVEDFIVVEKVDNKVMVMLDEKEVITLTFDNTLDVNEKVNELKDYFKFKTFQLANKEDIEKFINLYETICREWFSNYKKSLKKDVKNTKFTKKIVLG